MKVRALIVGMGMAMAHGCVTPGAVSYRCIRGIVFVTTGTGLSWLPNLQGRPVSCLAFGLDDDLENSPVPETIVPEDAK